MDKIQTWKKYQLFELFEDLDRAEKLLAEVVGGSAVPDISAQEFYEALSEEVYDLKHQNVPDFIQICLWFEPSSVWDGYVGAAGKELANRIYQRAGKWNEDNIKPVTKSGFRQWLFSIFTGK
jgi:hypothetical protein